MNNVDGKVARWAVAFDKLLEDKTGLNIFRVSGNSIRITVRCYYLQSHYHLRHVANGYRNVHFKFQNERLTLSKKHMFPTPQ